MGIAIGGYVLANSATPVIGRGVTVTPGTSCVQTLTFGGSPSAGAASTFTLGYDGYSTAPIAWSATNTTLRDRVDAALEALTSVGAGAVTTAVGTMTAGVGTLTVTFAGSLAARAVPTITVVANAMTGTAPTLAVTVTTPGVDATIAAA